MARIVFDLDVEFDPRFKLLAQRLGCPDRARGMLIRFWRIAQKYWGKDLLIPRSRFDDNNFTVLLDVGFAEERPDGFYAKGSKEYFAWYRKAIESGQRGGKKSAATRRRKYGSAIPAQAKNQPNPPKGHRRVASVENPEGSPKGRFGLPNLINTSTSINFSVNSTFSGETTTVFPPISPPAGQTSGLTFNPHMSFEKQLRLAASQIVGRIEGAIRAFGLEEAKAQKHVGDLGWSILQAKYPNWNGFCREYQSSCKDGRVTIFVAQLRDWIESSLVYLKREVPNASVDHNNDLPYFAGDSEA